LPLDEFLKPGTRRDLDVGREVQFHAGSEFEAPPRAAGDGEGLGGGRAGDDVLRRPPRPDVLQRPAGFLQPSHLEQPVEMGLVVVAAPPDAQGGRQQSLVDVEANRPARDAGQVGQVVDAVAARVVVHGP
jgi:hypothetical protein